MVREPRQVRKEAAVSDRLRVPRDNLAGAGHEGECELVRFDAGCTTIFHPPARRIGAQATFAAAVKLWPDAKITLRNGARIIEKTWTWRR